MDLTSTVAVVTGSGRGLPGWSADAIADVWPARFAGSQQKVGQQFPEPPK
jgi:hypothetical protein